MKSKKVQVLLSVLLFALMAFSCHSRQEPEVNISPHPVNSQADCIYRQAIALMQSSYNVDSTWKCIRFLDQALAIDSLNPDYYGVKAKLLSELGELDSALYVQTYAMEKQAITGEYLFQLGLYQAAKEMGVDAYDSFGKSRIFLQAVLKQYPDSFGAFILSETANSLYQKEDSLFMRHIDDIRKRFPDRLLEIEMSRKVKPHSLIRQIKYIQTQKENKIDLDSLGAN